MPTTTEALVVHAPMGDPSLEEIQLEDIQPHEALVQIEATGICHSDLIIIDGTVPSEFPSVLGHEGAGTVLEVGSAIKHVVKGDKMLLSFNRCSKCDECSNAHPAYCHKFGQYNFSGRRPDGSQPFSMRGKKLYASFFGQSSFAKISIVSGVSIVKVPASTKLELFASFGCGIQTGAGSVMNTLDVQKGQSLAVFGVGSVGLAAIMAGKLRGANPIIAVDLNDDRLRLALELGATHALNGKEVDVVKEIQAICPPSGVARAVDCSGVGRVIEQMIESIGVRGKAATVGVPIPGTKVSVDVLRHLGGREYVGCREGDSVPEKFIPYLIEQQGRGMFPVERITKIYDGKDYAQAFADVKQGRTIKAVIKW